ncbi:MAG: hypothetical protein LBF44_02930 [Holosporaceae bacterium]|nr:hypothetical protein [Holosporaceae bacterium]
MDEDFIEVYEIFQRRIKRFRSKIKQSKKILLVYVSNIDLYTDEDLVLKTEKISDILTKKYSGILSRKKHIDLLYILPVNSQVFKEKYLSENVKKIEMQYKDKYSTPNTEWKGIPELFNKTFSQVKLSKQIAYKKKFFELLIKLIPFKKLREKWGAL